MIPQGLIAQAQGTIPRIVNPQETGTNSLQMVIAPLGGQPLPPNAQISTAVLPVSTNPLYGLPNHPPPPPPSPSHHEPCVPPYIRGLSPHRSRRHRDVSGPYSDDSSSEGRDETPRRRRASRESRRHSHRSCDGPSRVPNEPPRIPEVPPMSAMERIQAYQVEIERLTRDVEREQQVRLERLRANAPVINLEAPGIQSQVEVPRI